MKRIVTVGLLALVPLVLNETPSCGSSKGGGSGDINHPNVQPLNPPKPSRIPKPGDTPRIEGDGPREVTFQATWDPDRPMELTWKINKRGKTHRAFNGYFSHDVIAHKGDFAEFHVENVGAGGATTCSIYINGLLYAPRDINDFHPFNESTGAGDCRASIPIP